MRAGVAILCWFLLTGAAPALAQSGTESAALPTADKGVDPAKPADSSPALLEREFFAIMRNGDTLKFLAYVPEDGVNLGREAEHATRAEIEDQITKRTGLYCRLFDSSCIQAKLKLDDSASPCSYRELLTKSEKVRTASTEATRNGVRQAILVAEVHNQRCAGPGLIDFIFNYHQGGWKLFSIP